MLEQQKNINRSLTTTELSFIKRFGTGRIIYIFLLNSSLVSSLPFLQMALKSFLQVAPESHFPLENLPYGVFKLQSGSEARPAVAIGDYILDLSVIASAGLFDGPLLSNSDCFNQVDLF